MRRYGVNFSLVMPIRNGASYIPSIKKNIEEMMRVGDELIIVDDDSADSSLKMIKDWAHANPRIHVLSNSSPGLANALNFGIRESTHNFIARVDVDDTYDPSRLFMQEKKFSDNCVAIFSDYTFHSEEGRHLGYMPSAVTPLASSLSLVSGTRTPHPSAVFRRDAFDSVGGYLQSDFPCEDLSLWLRLDKIGTIKSVPMPLLKYRLNRSGVSASKRKLMRTKKTDLLLKQGFRTQRMGCSLEDWEHEISELDMISLSNVRKMLVLRDLRLAKKLGIPVNKSESIEKIIIRDISFHMNTMQDVTRMAFDRLVRRYYR